MTKLPNEDIYEYWMPRLSGSAFKILYTVTRELDRLQVSEVQIGYQRLINKTGMSRNTVISSINENKNLQLLDYRHDGGKFFYRKGAIFGRVQILHPSKNSTGLKIAPRRMEDRVFWHWGNMFHPGEKILFDDARRRLLARRLEDMNCEPEIAGSRLRSLTVYRRILQCLRGYYRMGGPASFEEIFASVKTIEHGVFRYVSWRTRS
jgi:hypothetical protein